MRYAELTIDMGRACCKEHKKDCNKCPLRRERETKEGTKHTLFCWFILWSISQGIDAELCILQTEEIKYIDEFNKWKEDYERRNNS